MSRKPIQFIDEGLVKTTVTRGKQRRFEVYITDMDGIAHDPDVCYLDLIKEGIRRDDSPVGPYSCIKVGATGHWGTDPHLSESMSLGDWIARFFWRINGVPDGEDFNFVVEDLVQPYVDQPVVFYRRPV